MLKSVIFIVLFVLLPLLVLNLVVLLLLSHEVSEYPHFVVVVLVEVEFVLVSETNLEQVIVKTLFRYFYPFGSILKRKSVLLGNSLIAGTTVIPPPFENLVNDVTDSSLLGPPALAAFRHLINSSFFFVLTVAESVLESHQAMDHGNTEVLGFDGDIFFVAIILGSDADVFVDGVNAAIHVDTGFVEVEVDFLV